MASLDQTGAVRLAHRQKLSQSAVAAFRAEVEAPTIVPPTPAPTAGIPGGDVNLVVPVLPTPAPAPTPEETAVKPAAALPTLPGLPAAGAVPTENSASNDEELAALKQKLEEATGQLKELAEDRDMLTKQRDELLTAREELDAVRAAAAESNLRKTLLESGVELTHVDQDQFAEIVDKALLPALKREQEQRTNSTAALAEQVKQLQATLDASIKEAEAAQLRAQKKLLNDKILEKHPDLLTLKKDPAYIAYEAQPLQQGSSMTVGDYVAMEYARGNADSVIGVLNHFKGLKPNPEAVASVAPSVSATPVSSGASEDAPLTPEELEELRVAKRAGRVTREEFVTKMNRHREATAKAEAAVRR